MNIKGGQKDSILFGAKVSTYVVGFYQGKLVHREMVILLFFFVFLFKKEKIWSLVFNEIKLIYYKNQKMVKKKNVFVMHVSD